MNEQNIQVYHKTCRKARFHPAGRKARRETGDCRKEQVASVRSFKMRPSEEGQWEDSPHGMGSGEGAKIPSIICARRGACRGASAPVLHCSMARLGAQKAYELHCSRKSLTRPCSDMLPGSAENLPHVTFRWDSQRGGRGGLLFPILKAAGETRTCGFYAEMCLS